MENDFYQFLGRSLFGNSYQDYAVAGTVFTGVLAAALFSHWLLVDSLKRLSQKTSNPLDDTLGELVNNITSAEFAVFAFYFCTRSLIMEPVLHKLIKIVFVVVLTHRAVRLIQGLLDALVRTTAGRKNGRTDSAVRGVLAVLNAILWAGAVLFVLDNLGVDITAAVAGLGIGGIAVAMAAKEILGDLFSSFVIHMDKPFEIGDFIIVGDMMGVVDKIGIKTTRIRSLSGEMLVFSNSDLTNSRIRNYKLMEKRRVPFSFGIAYETPIEKVRSIPGLIKEIVEAREKTAFDRAHFKAFGDSALNFEVVYYVLSGDYNLHMDIQQSINLAMMERFQNDGIEFAYPTQTLHVKTETGAP